MEHGDIFHEKPSQSFTYFTLAFSTVFDNLMLWIVSVFQIMR